MSSNSTLVEDIEILLPVKFRWIPFSGFRGEVENVSANHRPGKQSCSSDRPEKHKLGRGLWDLASCQIRLNSIQQFQSSSRKCLSQSEDRVTILFFRSTRKNTNLVEDVEILLPVKLRWNPFCGFRGEVKNVSANQRPGPPSCLHEWPEKHKLGRGRRYLASCQVSLNSVQQFQTRSRKCLSQSEAWVAILFFSDRAEKHKLGRGCQVSLNSVQKKVENVKSLWRTDGQHNSALESSAQVH